jgi:hypothetical protein
VICGQKGRRRCATAGRLKIARRFQRRVSFERMERASCRNARLGQETPSWLSLAQLNADALQVDSHAQRESSRFPRTSRRNWLA